MWMDFKGRGQILTILKQWSISLNTEVQTEDLESTRLGISGFPAEADWTFQCSSQFSLPTIIYSKTSENEAV